MAWRYKCKKCMACKKYISKKLMPVAWHSTRWWIVACQMTKKKKKEIEAFLIDEK